MTSHGGLEFSVANTVLLFPNWELNSLVLPCSVLSSFAERPVSPRKHAA